LLKLNVPLANTDGPLTVSEKTQNIYPDKASLIRQITDLYIQLRYSSSFSTESYKQFKELINRF